MTGTGQRGFRWILISALACFLFLAAGNPVTDTASAADKIRQEIGKKTETFRVRDPGELPDKIEEAAAVSSGEYIRIRWKPSLRAEGYIIEKRTENGSFKSRAISSRRDDCAYTDFDVKPGITYQYRVRPYRNVKGVCYTAGDTDTAMTEAVLAVPVITDIRYNRAGTYATITWKKVETADRYLICTETDEGTEYKQITGENMYRLPIEKGKSISVRIRASAVSDGKRIYSGSEKNGVTLSAPGDEKLKILFEGDSITYGKTWKERSEVPVPRRVAQLLGCRVVNRAVSGSVAGNPADQELPELYDRLIRGKTDYRNYDIICIGIGTNDYGFSIPLGTQKDTQKDGTFYGYMNTCLKKIREQNPSAAIVLETPIYRTRVGKSDKQAGYHTPNSLGHTLEDYQDAIVHIAEGKDNIYIYNSQEKSVINEQNADTYLYDGLHPCDEGYAAIGNSLAEFLQREVLKIF